MSLFGGRRRPGRSQQLRRRRASAGAILSAQEPTDTGTTDESLVGTSKGSWWAFGLALLGLAAGIGGIFFWDLYKTNRRQDKALEYLKRNPQILSESDRARMLDKLTTGTEGLTRGLLGFSLIGLFAIALLYLLIRNPEITNSDVVQNAMAALITLVTAVVAFYFGTRSAQTSIASLPPCRCAPGETMRERSRRCRMRCRLRARSLRRCRMRWCLRAGVSAAVG